MMEKRDKTGQVGTWNMAQGAAKAPPPPPACQRGIADDMTRRQEDRHGTKQKHETPRKLNSLQMSLLSAPTSKKRTEKAAEPKRVTTISYNWGFPRNKPRNPMPAS